MASSRVGRRMSERIGPRLPLVEGEEVESIFMIIGIRKLRVLPVPVEAVARMSAPSSAGGIAPACTGVGITKFAAARRCLSGAGRLKWLSGTALESAWVMCREGASGAGFKIDSSVRVDKVFLKVFRSFNEGMQRRGAWALAQVSVMDSKISIALENRSVAAARR